METLQTNKQICSLIPPATFSHLKCMSTSHFIIGIPGLIISSCLVMPLPNNINKQRNSKRLILNDLGLELVNKWKTFFLTVWRCSRSSPGWWTPVRDELPAPRSWLHSCRLCSISGTSLEPDSGPADLCSLNGNVKKIIVLIQHRFRLNTKTPKPPGSYQTRQNMNCVHMARSSTNSTKVRYEQNQTNSYRGLCQGK